VIGFDIAFPEPHENSELALIGDFARTVEALAIASGRSKDQVVLVGATAVGTWDLRAPGMLDARGLGKRRRSNPWTSCRMTDSASTA